MRSIVESKLYETKEDKDGHGLKVIQEVLETRGK